jgi:PAS domain S-box-containing protein
MFNSSSDIMYDIDLITDEVLLSDGYQTEFGYPITHHMKTADVWGKHLHPEDKEKVLEDYQRMLASLETGWTYNYRFLRADGSVANILSSRIILRSIDGIAYRMIGSMQDISKQTVLEEKLAHEISLKERQIADAMQEAKEAERSELGKELHDNVNQLLGASRLYLEMAKQGGENSKMHLSRSAEYTLTAIEEIRKLTKGLATDSIKNLGLYDAIENLTSDIMEVNMVKISCEFDLTIESKVNDQFKINVFRIIQEQLNNILKHAQAKQINIRFSQTENTIVLMISDNGVGFDTAVQRKGIGLDNIRSRAVAFDGKADFISEPGRGCVLNVAFSITDKTLKQIKNPTSSSQD